MSRDFDARDFEDLDSDSRLDDWNRPSPGRVGGDGTEGPSRNQAVEALRDIVDEAARERPTVSEFFDRLKAKGVTPIASVQASGRWNGIAYDYNGARVKGSHLGRAYTAQGLQQRRGVRYDRARDDETLARSSPARQRAWPVGDREPEIRPRERESRVRDISGLSPAERAVLWDVGRFRTVETEDLRQARYAGCRNPLQQDLKHLASLRYLERRVLPVDGRGRTIEVVALSREGRRLLDNTRMDRNAQALYNGFVKPREIAHDAALYRVYLTEADRIEKEGGKARRVILDFELKKRVYSPLANAVNLPPAEYADRQEEIAKENRLRVVDGHIVLPDLRLEYETRDGEERHIDLELVTQNYRAAHVSGKAAAGFKIYADPGSNALHSVLNDHDVIAELLRM